MGRPTTKRPSQDISTDLADKLVCDARRAQSHSTIGSVASIPRQRPGAFRRYQSHYSVVAVRHQRGYISVATPAWVHVYRSFDGGVLSLVSRIRPEAGFLFYFPFLLPFGINWPSRGQSAIPSSMGQDHRRPRAHNCHG